MRVFSEAYKYLVTITKSYKRMYERSIVPGDYNAMIKKTIDNEVLIYSIEAVEDRNR